MGRKISILSIFFVTNLYGAVFTPVLQEISSNFSNGHSVAKLFLVIPSLFFIPIVLTAGFLVHVFSKKSLILFGISLYIIASLGCLFSFNAASLLFFRALYGIGAGLIIPYSISLIDYYYKYEEKDTLIAYSVLTIFGGSIIFLFLIGLLNNFYWKLSFLPGLLCVIPLLLSYKNIDHISVKVQIHKYPFIYNLIFKKQIIIIIIMYFVVSAIMFQYFINITFLLQEHNIHMNGMLVTYATMIFYLFAMLSNLIMNHIKKISVILLIALQMMLIGNGFFLLSSEYLNITAIYFASAMIGAGFGSIGSSFICIMLMYVSSINKIHSLSLLYSAMALGQFMTSIIFEIIKKLFNIKLISSIYNLNSILFISAAIALLIYFGYKSIKHYIQLHEFPS